VGDAVLVTADLSKSTATTLEATDVVVNPAADASRPVEIEGVILAIDETTRTLTVSADDDHESGQMIAVTFPSTIDISGYKVGDSIEVRATLNSDGQTYTATEIDGDECDHNGDLEDHHGDRGGDDANNNEDQGDDHQQDDATQTADDHSGHGHGGDDSSDDR
jgi:hypothetical protein